MVEVLLSGPADDCHTMGPLHCPLCVGLGILCLFRTGALAVLLLRMA